jgi:hypothetical protein
MTAEEYMAVQAGQQMIEVCQVCGKEVVFNDQNTCVTVAEGEIAHAQGL